MQTLSPPGLYYDVPATRRHHATERIDPFTLFWGGIFRPLLKAQENLDPLKLMPNSHKLLYENQLMRMIESKFPAGGQEPKHGILAAIDAEITTFPGGKTGRVHRTAGTAGWSEATIHEVTNVGSTALSDQQTRLSRC